MSDVTNESKRIRSSEDNTNNHQSFNQSIAKKKKTDNPSTFPAVVGAAWL
jgi:hypothetical protein